MTKIADVQLAYLQGIEAALSHARTLMRATVMEQRTRVVATFAYRHWDAVTPNVPEGYDTILGYLAKNHADILDVLDYADPEVTQRDGFKMMHMVRREGLCIVYVPAPDCLKAAGIKTVRAYPLSILAQRWV